MSPEHVIPINIRRIRVARGMTQVATANAAGISRQAFVGIENGRTKEPRVSNLQAIADAFDVPIIDLFAEVPALSTVRFRTNSIKTKKDKARKQQYLIDAAYWLRDFCFLQSVVNDSKGYLLKPVFEQLHGSNTQRPEKAAGFARQALGLNKGDPIGDLAGLMEQAGIKIRTVPFDLHNFFGFSVSESDGGPAIIVNSSDDVTIERRIFTVAHELGHLLLHPAAYDPAQTTENTQEEKEANRFAGYFLMPQTAFTRKREDSYGLSFYNRVLFIKRFFGVSYLTVLQRLADMGLADHGSLIAKFRSIHMNRTGASLAAHVEPVPLAGPDFVEDYLSTLVRKAFEAAHITVSRAAEILHIPLAQMRDLINSWADVAA